MTDSDGVQCVRECLGGYLRGNAENKYLQYVPADVTPSVTMYIFGFVMYRSVPARTPLFPSMVATEGRRLRKTCSLKLKTIYKAIKKAL